MIRLVRRYVADEGELFTNQVVVDQLALYAARTGPSAVRLAAADLLDQVAVSEVLVSKVIRTQDLSTDGSKVSAELRAHAAALRQQVKQDEAEEAGDIGFFHIIPGGEATRFEGEEARLWLR